MQTNEHCTMYDVILGLQVLEESLEFNSNRDQEMLDLKFYIQYTQWVENQQGMWLFEIFLRLLQ